MCGVRISTLWHVGCLWFALLALAWNWSSTKEIDRIFDELRPVSWDDHERWQNGLDELQVIYWRCRVTSTLSLGAVVLVALGKMTSCVVQYERRPKRRAPAAG